MRVLHAIGSLLLAAALSFQPGASFGQTNMIYDPLQDSCTWVLMPGETNPGGAPQRRAFHTAWVRGYFQAASVHFGDAWNRAFELTGPEGFQLMVTNQCPDDGGGVSVGDAVEAVVEAILND